MSYRFSSIWNREIPPSHPLNAGISNRPSLDNNSKNACLASYKGYMIIIEILFFAGYNEPNRSHQTEQGNIDGGIARGVIARACRLPGGLEITF